MAVPLPAINKSMDTLLKSDNKVITLKYLSDSCRLLSDLHYCLSKDRIKLIASSLKRTAFILLKIQNVMIPHMGTLSEKIKASKAIEMQGYLSDTKNYTKSEK